ncbi:MAG: OmpA family protein [Proteobacteria bacterium]|nr:OmpA family protein [Pseudomonadota bacterium]
MSWLKGLVIFIAILLAGFILYTLYLRFGPYERLSQENQDLKEEVAKLRLDFKEGQLTKDELAKKSQQVEDLQTRLDGLRTTITEMEVERKKVVTEAERLRKALEESEIGLDELTGEIERLTKGHSQEIDGLKQQLVQKDRQMEDLQNEAGRLRETITKAEDSAGILGREKDELKRQLEESTNRMQELSQAMAAREKKLEEVGQTHQELVKRLEKQIQDRELEISALEEKLSIRFLDRIIFEPGNAVVTSRGHDVLKTVADELKKLPGTRIHVEGHTDNLPLSQEARAVYIDNLGLSMARAAAVVRALRTMGMDPQFLSAAGYSMYRPVASNDTPEGREQNRRVEIVLIPAR